VHLDAAVNVEIHCLLLAALLDSLEGQLKMAICIGLQILLLQVVKHVFVDDILCKCSKFQYGNPTGIWMSKI